jgi:hypothetical protein
MEKLTCLRGLQVKFPYDVGALANIRSVLGQSFILWCLPKEIVGDGLWFPTNNRVGTSSAAPTRNPEWERPFSKKDAGSMV